MSSKTEKIFGCESFGADGDVSAELVFSTAMVGYVGTGFLYQKFLQNMTKQKNPVGRKPFFLPTGNFYRGLWKPLPIISLELLMAMKADGSLIRMKLRSSMACERLMMVMMTVFSSFL